LAQLTIIREGVNIGGRYRVYKLYKIGGMSKVWLARDLETGQTVVVKEPRLDQNVILNVEKIRHEAHVLKRIRHTNIVNLLKALELLKDLNIDGATVRPAILVLEYVNGPSLLELRRRMELSRVEILNIMSQLCAVVSYIHKNNIIHRDLKPCNVLTQNTGTGTLCKVIDFGTSRYYFDQMTSKEIVISPGGYTAPEQYMGVSTPQSDIWSLGAILFYLITGRDPIVDLPGYPNATQRPPDPARFVRDVDERLRYVIARAMHPDMSMRYLTAEQMLMDLQGYFREELRPGCIQIAVKGQVYTLDADCIIIGRGDDPNIPIGIYQDGKYVYMLIYDPNKYISRRHCMIFRKGRKWYLRDLGSLNKTAVYRQGFGWIIIHRGYRVESPDFELMNGDIVSIVYDEKKGPYLQMSIRFM